MSAELELADEAALTTPEIARLARLEIVIEDGLATFVKVGEALLAIRSERLYREAYDTFEDYCRDRLGMTRQHANRTIVAAEVAGVLEPMGSIPASCPGGRANARPLNERQARELAPLLEDEQELVDTWRKLRARYGDKVTAEKVRDVVSERLTSERTVGTLKSSDSVEWYTPELYIEAAREVLGEIDLDPASCPLANKTAYGKACGRFVAKALLEYQTGHAEAAILLLNGYAFDTRWFRPLWDHVLCFTYSRIDFYSATRRMNGGVTGSVFVYLGPDRVRFAQVFSRFGAVVERSRLLQPPAVGKAA